MSSDEAGAEFEGCTRCRCHESQPIPTWKPAVLLSGATLGELLVLGGLLSVNIISFLQALSGGFGLLQPAAAVISWFYAILTLMLPLLVRKAWWRQHQPWAHSGATFALRC